MRLEGLAFVLLAACDPGGGIRERRPGGVLAAPILTR